MTWKLSPKATSQLKKYTPAVLWTLALLWVIFPMSKWQLDANQCRDQGVFCWSFLRAKMSFLFFGLYPREFLWRPLLLIMLSIFLGVWLSKARWWNRWLLFYYFGLLLLYPLLLGGFGEGEVSLEKWGGMPLTLMLILTCTGPALVLGMVLALARRSQMPMFRWVSTAMIELVRAVPLISLLFMASVMWPLFFPAGWDVPKLMRAMLVLIFFMAAYMAEVVRGGLQAVGPGQFEAAQSLGLNYLATMRLVILPQAVGHVIRPMINTIIGMAKDTSLVMIIALFDFMGAVKTSLSDMEWPGFSVEAYLFAAVIYYVLCRSLSWLGDRWQAHFQRGSSR